MDADIVGFVSGDHGRREIESLIESDISEADVLPALSKLRQRFTQDEASALVEQALLIKRGGLKFPHAPAMVFERSALEQATSLPVSVHRATRLASISPSLILDASVGIGGDAIALTSLAPVVGMDIDPLRLMMARHNVGAVGGRFAFHPLRADSMTVAPFQVDVVFADPARRTRDRRVRGLDAYSPPVKEFIGRWLGYAGTVGVKVAPGVKEDEIPAGAAVEWVSLHGRLREAVIWVGDHPVPGERVATALPGGASLTGPEPEVAVSPIGGYLHEPDDAVIRAGLVRVVAHEIGATLIDSRIAYLTTDTQVEHPLVMSYRIDHVEPFNLKSLRRRLIEADVGSVTIKKRGSPLTPEELRPRLRLTGTRHATVILTRIGDKPIMAISLDAA